MCEYINMNEKLNMKKTEGKNLPLFAAVVDQWDKDLHIVKNLTYKAAEDLIKKFMETDDYKRAKIFLAEKGQTPFVVREFNQRYI